MCMGVLKPLTSIIYIGTLFTFILNLYFIPLSIEKYHAFKSVSYHSTLSPAINSLTKASD